MKNPISNGVRERRNCLDTTSQVSSCLRKIEGFLAYPTPAGVPIAMTSPGSRVVTSERYSISVATSKIMSEVLPSCTKRSLIGGHQFRTECSGVVKSFTDRPSGGFALIVSNRAVIETGVSRDIVQSPLGWHLGGQFSEDHGELRFEVEHSDTGGLTIASLWATRDVLHRSNTAG
jgi:hypothetical protein